MSAPPYTLYSLLEEMRERPAMYIGNTSVLLLEQYLLGFNFACYKYSVGAQELPPFLGFHDWTARRLGFAESTPGWSYLILASVLGWTSRTANWETIRAVATPEEESTAFYRFYELWDEYRQESGAV